MIIFPTHNSVLDGNALMDRIFRLYKVNNPISCQLNRRSMCDAYEVKCESGLYYLKIYMHGRRTKRDLDAEMLLLGHLHRQGVGISMPVAKKNGSLLMRIAAPEGIRYAALFPAAPGRCPNDSENDDEALGRAVAQFHNQTDGIRKPLALRQIDWNHLIDASFQFISPLLAHRPGDLAIIRSIADDAKARVDELLLPLRDTLAWGLCHGDFHGGDARIDENGHVTFFDFDSSGYGWRPLDIGIFLATKPDWMDVRAEGLVIREKRWQAFLNGYCSERPLHPNERAAARLCPPIRHIFLMGAVLRYTIHREGNHWANDDFINWHMDWFRWWKENRK